MADYWQLVGASPAGGVEDVVREDSRADLQLDQRHLMLRGETVGLSLDHPCVMVSVLQLSNIFKIRSAVTQW